MTILNRSASPATVGPVTLPAPYSLVSPPVFPLTVSAGASVPLVVRFAPPTRGNYDGPLSLVTSDSALPVFKVALSGFADAPDLSVSENSGERFNFESGEERFQVQPGTGDFQGLKISLESRNSSAPVLIHNIIPPAGFRVFNAPVYPFNMASGDSRNIWIQCEEISTGFYEGWVTILSNDSQKSPFQFYVTSRVGSVADLRVSSMTNDSDSAAGLIVNGDAGAQTLPLRLHLRNQGDLPLTVSAVSLPTGFEFVSPPSLPVTLNLFGSRILPEIQLTATELGTYSGAVVISSNDPDEGSFSFALSETIPGGEVSVLSTSGVAIRASEPGVAAGVSGMIVGGQVNATAFVEASVDLGQTDPWRVIGTVLLDANGEGSFGNPSPIEDPQSLGSAQWFFRIRQ